MSTKLFRLIALFVVVALVIGGTNLKSAKADPVTITWFVGLGTGAQAAQLDAENKVVADFNASQSDIVLKINITDNKVANDTLATMIAGGNAPDIVGPVGVAGSNSFYDEWMDLSPIIKSSGYNISQYPEALAKIYARPDGDLYGIPFAVYPGLMYFNKDMFDEAGLAYPPLKFGDKYKLDGKDVDWTWDVVAQISKKLTVDSAGNDATSDKFDATKTVKFGFVQQYDTIRSDWETFGGAPLVDDSGKVKITDAWRAESQWMWNGLWKDHTIPTASYSASDLLKPSEFASGNVGMARVMLWYTCCLGDSKFKFDLGTVPMYNGQYYAPTDADSFRIDKNTKNADAAFKVLTYLLGDAALPLLSDYGAFPARADIQQAYIDIQSKKYPSVTNWAIANPALAYAAVPHHESNYPNFNKGQNLINDFHTWLYSDQAATGDVNAALDKLQSDLQASVDAAGAPAAAATTAK